MSEIHGQQIEEQPGILHDVLVQTASQHSAKTAVVCLHQPADLYSFSSRSKHDGDYLRWTFSELTKASHALALALAGSGLRPGMNIVAFLENGIEGHMLLRASAELNCSVAFLNPACVGNDREVKHFFEIVEPKVVVTSSIDAAKKVEKAASHIIKNCCIALVASIAADEVPKCWQQLGTVLERNDESDKLLEELDLDRKLDDKVLILFTSGTTNLPKGIAHSNKGLTSAFSANVKALEPTQKSVLCCLPSFFHGKHSFSLYWL